jgi:hypothetical protein
MYLTGWDALAADASLEGITVRRKAAAPASLACGIYFGLLWTRCIGGPILNFLVYPAVITVYMPAEVFALFQPIPPDYLAYDPRPGEADLSATISGLYVGAPAAVSSFLTAILWAIFKPTEVVNERLEAHAPPGWGDDEA